VLERVRRLAQRTTRHDDGPDDIEIDDDVIDLTLTRNVLMLHDTDVTPDDNWYPWLKNQLSWRGYDVTVPELPESDAPDIDRYWDALQSYDFDEETVIVGHGSGAVMALACLHRLPRTSKIRLVVCVAPFYRDSGLNAAGLFTEEYDWQKIRRQADRIEVVWSDTDPYVEREQIDVVTEKLGIRPHIIEGAGHFSLSEGERYRRLPIVSEIIDAWT
jgi:uncharacterized protein